MFTKPHPRKLIFDNKNLTQLNKENSIHDAQEKENLTKSFKYFPIQEFDLKPLNISDTENENKTTINIREIFEKFKIFNVMFFLYF